MAKQILSILGSMICIDLRTKTSPVTTAQGVLHAPASASPASPGAPRLSPSCRATLGPLSPQPSASAALSSKHHFSKDTFPNPAHPISSSPSLLSETSVFVFIHHEVVSWFCPSLDCEPPGQGQLSQLNTTSMAASTEPGAGNVRQFPNVKQELSRV